MIYNKVLAFKMFSYEVILDESILKIKNKATFKLSNINL